MFDRSQLLKIFFCLLYLPFFLLCLEILKLHNLQNTSRLEMLLCSCYSSSAQAHESTRSFCVTLRRRRRKRLLVHLSRRNFIAFLLASSYIFITVCNTNKFNICDWGTVFLKNIFQLNFS